MPILFDSTPRGFGRLRVHRVTASLYTAARRCGVDSKFALSMSIRLSSRHGSQADEKKVQNRVILQLGYILQRVCPAREKDCTLHIGWIVSAPLV